MTADTPPRAATPPRRRGELERERDHFLEQADRTATDPALALETALWRALADEVDGYLSASAEGVQAGLFGEARGSPAS